MNLSKQLRAENKKTNWIFLSTTISAVVFSIVAFLTVKITLDYYGEAINGVVRFIMQIITYLLVLQNGLVLIFQIKIIKLYANKDLKKIAFVTRYLGSITKVVGVGFLLLIISISWVPSHFLSTQLIPTNLVYFLFLALSANVFFTIFCLQKNHTLLVGTNQAYISFTICAIFKVIVCTYFLVVALAYPPKLEFVWQNGTQIHTFLPGNLPSVYALGVAFFLLGTEPVLSSIVLHVFIKKKNKNLFSYDYKEYLKYKKIIKKEVWKGVGQAVVLNCAFLVIFTTDEFVILLFKGRYGGLGILRFISIYGLYANMSATVRNLLEGYVVSKKALLGYSSSQPVQRREIMQKVRTNTQFLAAGFLIFSTIVVPVLVYFLFAPAKSFQKTQYVNFGISFPVGVFGWMVLINAPNKIEMEIDNKLKTLILIFVGEAILNIVLSTTISVLTGVIYWIFWASVIAAFCKLMFFELYVAAQKKAINSDKILYSSQMLVFKNKVTYLTMCVLLPTIVALPLLWIYEAPFTQFVNDPNLFVLLITGGSLLTVVCAISLIAFMFWITKINKKQKIKNFT